MTTANPFPSRPPTAPASALDRSDSDVVLIVDDVPDNLAVLHDALDESGYTVLVALHGEAALQRAAQALPDIVLLDAMMPGMDGFEVARRLKASPATAHIPIIFMTGLTETEHLVAALGERAEQRAVGGRVPVAPRGGDGEPDEDVGVGGHGRSLVAASSAATTAPARSS